MGPQSIEVWGTNQELWFSVDNGAAQQVQQGNPVVLINDPYSDNHYDVTVQHTGEKFIADNCRWFCIYRIDQYMGEVEGCVMKGHPSINARRQIPLVNTHKILYTKLNGFSTVGRI